MTDHQFNLPIKITWRTDLSQNWSTLFYTTVVEKLEKAQEKFEESFEIKDLVVDENVLYNIFGPVYDKEVASRPDYHLNRGQQFATLMERISNGTEYRLYCAIEKETNQFTGGIIYRIKDDSIAISLRAFDKEITRKYRFRITADYWLESKFFEVIQPFGKAYASHGKDKNPRIGGVGLWLYKLKVGSRPCIPPEGMESKIFSQEQFMNSLDPVLFFDNPNEHGHYQDAYLFYKKESVDASFMNELEVVLKWTGMNVHVHA